MTKNKKITIYLLKQNLPFEQYLKEINNYTVKRLFIDKENMGTDVISGRIYLFSKLNSPVPWANYVEELAKKKKVGIKPNSDQKAIIFLKVYCSETSHYYTFALTFSGAHQLLDSSLIVNDFALKASKSLVSPDKVASIDSITIDRKIYNTRKQSSSHLLPDKMLTSGEYNIVKKFHGSGESRKLILSANLEEKLLVGGEAGLNVSGKFDLSKDLPEMLVSLAKIYKFDTEDDQLFKVPENLKKIIDSETKKQLNEELGEKLKLVLFSNSIDKRNLKGIAIQPQKIFDLETFNGFFITGLGYKDTQQTGDFEINEVDYFERLQKIHLERNLFSNGNDIIEKMHLDVIKRKFIDGTPSEKVCTVYQALSIDLTYRKDKYILVAGEWYQIDRNFYAHLKHEIDNIPSNPSSQNIDFIPFDVKKHTDASGNKREGLYNEDLAETTHVLMLDRTKYSPGREVLRKFQFKSGSNIEISDLFLYDKNDIHFIHVKRHSGGAAGTSHLLAQAIVSAKTFNEDTQNVIDFIQTKIKEHNEKPQITYSLLPYENKNQKKLVTLAIIDKNAFIKPSKAPRKNSASFSILEMISIMENVSLLKNLGYEYYLKFIDSNEV